LINFRCNVNYGDLNLMDYIKTHDFNDKKVQDILSAISKDLWNLKVIFILFIHINFIHFL
jgi:hypothetical protein